MEIKQVGTEMLIGSNERGYTHLCFVVDYVEPYQFTPETANMLKSAGVITEEEYNELILGV